MLCVNEAYARRHGSDPIELVGCKLLELVPTEDGDALRAQVVAALCTDKVLERCQPDHRGGRAPAIQRTGRA